MSGSGRQPPEGEEELGADVANFEPVGGGSKGVGSLLQGGSPGSVSVQGGDVGTDSQDGAGPEYFSTQCLATAHREVAEEVGGVGVGTILRWRRQCRKWYSRRSGTTSRGGRIWSRSILRRNQFLTSVSGLLGGQGRGCLGGGGSRTDWTWRGQRRDQRWSCTERRRKARRRYWHRKIRRAGNEDGSTNSQLNTLEGKSLVPL